MTVTGTALVVLGTLLLAVAALGVVRLPDAYARASAVAKAGGLGLVLVLAGAAALLGPGAGWRLAVAVVFQLVTVPVAGYALARAARRTGTPLWEGTRYVERQPPGTSPPLSSEL